MGDGIGGRLTPKTGGTEVETRATHPSRVFIGLRQKKADKYTREVCGRGLNLSPTCFGGQLHTSFQI